MNNFEKQALFTYDEPITYSEFLGGINTDPNNENILQDQLRSVTNMHYSHNSLKKRQGAKQILNLNFEEDVFYIQGVFILATQKTKYIIIAADGKLYYDIYYQKNTSNLKRLDITHPTVHTDLYHNSSYQFTDLDKRDNEIEGSVHTGYVLNKEGIETLIFQNSKRIEAVSHNQRLFITTGTRFCYVREHEDKGLIAEVVLPYKPNGVEYKEIGPNLLSPFPDICQKFSSQGVMTNAHGLIPLLLADGNLYRLQTIMTYGQGKTASDYNFKWEEFSSSTPRPVNLHNVSNMPLIFNSTMSMSGSPISVGRDRVSITSNALLKGPSRYRVTFAEDFKEDSEGNKSLQVINTPDGGYEDFQINRVSGGWNGSILSVSPMTKEDESHKIWKQIQTCTKITSDGNKFLLYDDLYGSGCWFKTVIDKPGYITYRGILSFQTNKNEKVMKVLHFKGIIIVFSNSDILGGNIAVVLGDGDDFPDDNYSPYIRRTVNTSISTDNGNTVQVADNFILFKNKKTVYMIEGGQLNSEIIQVQSVNEHIKQNNQYLSLPWEDNNCISEITEDHYSIIWKEKTSMENGEIYIDRPAVRVKMYYRMGRQDGNLLIFPWLVDQGKVFNIDSMTYIQGNPHYIYDQRLIAFTDSNNFKDLGETYKCKIHFKGYDLQYPKLIKFVGGVLLYYYRTKETPFDMDIVCKNEAGFNILQSPGLKKVSIEDFALLKEGSIIDSTTKLGDNIVDTKGYHIPIKFPALLADTYIEFETEGDFSLGSITYIYHSTKIPVDNVYSKYGKILQRDSTPPPISDIIEVIGGTAKDEGGDSNE